MLTVYVVRHGQTDYNHEGIIQGQMNIHLNAMGAAQAAALATALEDVHFDYAFSSDLSRASATAMTVLGKQQDEVSLLEQVELRERDMGELQGTKGPPPHTSQDKASHGIEASHIFVRRCTKWYRDTILPLAKTEKNHCVLVSGHGAFIITLFRQLALPIDKVGLGYEVAPSIKDFNHCHNTAIAIIRVESDGTGFISKFNDHRHVAVKGPQGPTDLAV